MNDEAAEGQKQMGTWRTSAAAAVAVAVAGGAVGHAMAAPATLSISGTIDGSIDDTPFAANSSFTAIESFDPAQNHAGGGVASYSEALTFIIGNVGTFTVVPSNDLDVVIDGPPASPSQGTYLISLPSQDGPLNAYFNAAATTEIAGGAWQTTYSDLASYTQPTSPPFQEDLVGGGTLTITDFSALDSATMLVPEPASLALLGLGAAAAASVRRSRRG